MKRIRVLFIGNSLTYANDLPAMLERLSRSAIATKFSGDGGMTLRMHWDKGEARKLIRDGHFDAVVLQPQSSEGVAHPDELRRYARLFADEIRRSGAKCLLFCTWTPRPWSGMRAEYTRGLLALARQIGATPVPVAVAWSAVSAKVQLYADDVHPNVAGTYLAACTFLGTLAGARCTDHPREIDDATAALIAKEGWAAAQRWRYARIIGRGTSSRVRGLRPRPREPSVKAPRSCSSPGSPKITSEPPTASP